MRKKKVLPFVTQYQPLVSTLKEKVDSSYKINHYFAILKNHLLLPTRKENHGKELPRQQSFLYRLSKSPLNFFFFARDKN